MSIFSDQIVAMRAGFVEIHFETFGITRFGGDSRARNLVSLRDVADSFLQSRLLQDGDLEGVVECRHSKKFRRQIVVLVKRNQIRDRSYKGIPYLGV